MRRTGAWVLAVVMGLGLAKPAAAGDDPAETYGFTEDDGGDGAAEGGGGAGFAEGAGGLEFRWGGKIQSDVRWRVSDVAVGGWYQRLVAKEGVSRNENIVGFKGEALSGDIAGVLELDFVWLGVPEAISGIGDLSRRERVDPYRLEAHAAYVEVVDFLVEGMDLRVGQQLVLWGKADQFNPTNTINANDIEDPLLLGEQRANLMARLDYNFWDSWTLSGVLVPIFKPALLPPSAELGLVATDRIPAIDENLRSRLHVEKVLAHRYFDYPAVTSRVTPHLPETSAENMQLAFRVSGTVLEQDIALSYYRGRSDRPQAYENYITQRTEERCDPDDPAACIKGVVDNELKLHYPRMEVIGLNLAGEIPLGPLNPLGYRLELGVYLPQRTEFRITQEKLDFGMIVWQAGEYDYDLDGEPGAAVRPTVVASTPFAKWTLGLDYSIGRHVMLIAMWIHGMFDEYGAGDWISEGYDARRGWSVLDPDEVFQCVAQEQLWLAFDGAVGQRCPYEQHAAEILRPKLGDYLMLDIDIKFLDDKALLRLVGIFDLIGVYEARWTWRDPEDHDRGGYRKKTHHGMFTEKGFSASLFPEFTYNLGDGFELGVGGLINLGKSYSRFGDASAGGSLVWTRARFQY